MILNILTSILVGTVCFVLLLFICFVAISILWKVPLKDFLGALIDSIKDSELSDYVVWLICIGLISLYSYSSVYGG